MVDLETVGTRADAPILQIAAVRFSLDAPGDGLDGVDFFRNVLLDGPGQGPIDPETLLWWLDQNPLVRANVFLESGPEGDPHQRVPLRQALVELAAYLRSAYPKPPDLWACAPSFDATILRDAARRTEVQALAEPLHFRYERCFRTLRKLGDNLGVRNPGGGAPPEHNALADARAQARHAVAILRTLRPSKAPAQ